MHVWKVYAMGAIHKGKPFRRRWLASFAVETDANVYADQVRKCFPTWAVEINQMSR